MPGPLRSRCEFLFLNCFHPVVERDKLLHGDSAAMAVVAGDDSGGEVVRYYAIGLDAEDRDSFTAEAGISDAQEKSRIAHRTTPHPAKLSRPIAVQPRCSILQESAPVLALVGRRNLRRFRTARKVTGVIRRLPERHQFDGGTSGWAGAV